MLLGRSSLSAINKTNLDPSHSHSSFSLPLPPLDRSIRVSISLIWTLRSPFRGDRPIPTPGGMRPWSNSTPTRPPPPALVAVRCCSQNTVRCLNVAGLSLLSALDLKEKERYLEVSRLSLPTPPPSVCNASNPSKARLAGWLAPLPLSVSSSPPLPPLSNQKVRAA